MIQDHETARWTIIGSFSHSSQVKFFTHELKQSQIQALCKEVGGIV